MALSGRHATQPIPSIAVSMPSLQWRGWSASHKAKAFVDLPGIASKVRAGSPRLEREVQGHDDNHEALAYPVPPHTRLELSILELSS